MADTDIQIREIEVDFSLEPFRVPLMLSSGPIHGCDFASVRITVQNRSESAATGCGGMFLSDAWCFPGSELSHEEKAACMKETVLQFAELLRGIDGYYDPFQIAIRIDQPLRQVLRDVQARRNMAADLPQLLGAVCWSPFDAAIHDAWGRAAGRCCYDMYDRHFLNEDLSLFLGDAWRGVYPADVLKQAVPKRSILVQHVIGVGDPLTEQDLSETRDPKDGLPVALNQWIEKERIRRLKVKLKGNHTAEDVEWIRSVYAVAAESFERLGGARDPVKLCLDPNEAFDSSEQAEELLLLLKEKDLDCYHAVEYMEQPTPRDLQGISMLRVGALKPVILDESSDSIESLQLCEAFGWSGVALKTCKGHSHAIISYCWAKQHGKFITVQDLTNAGIAFMHSAHLWSRLELSTDSLEYNSRQYTPYSFPEWKEKHPELFRVIDGKVSVQSLEGIGLY